MNEFYQDAEKNIYAVMPIHKPDPSWQHLTEEEVYQRSNLLKQVPEGVTKAQGKATLIQRGLWPSVLAYATTIEDEAERALADVALNDTTHWQRDSPFLNAAATALGLSDEQMDELFIAAAQIQL